MTGFDICYVLRVVLGNVDGVMRQIESPVDAEIKHESRTGELLFRDFLVTPSTSEMVRHQAFHGARKVPIDDNRIPRIGAGPSPKTNRTVFLKKHLLDWFIEQDLHA